MANRDLTPLTGGRGMMPFGRDPFGSFRQEMDRLFDDFFAPAEPRTFGGDGRRAALWPSVELHETDQAYIVTAELAGLDEKDIELNLRDNALILSGEKRQERTDGNGERSYTERTYGRFARTIPLPAEVDAERVEAKFHNGVLTVTLPKNPRAQDQARRIEVKAQ
jgi:HSP20 family protein